MTDNAIRGGIWFSLRRWASLPIWVLLLFICVTGTISVVSYEITWLVDARTRAFNPDDRPPLDYGEITAAVARERPGATIHFIADRAPYLAIQVGAALPEAPSASVYVNQYTGEVQGVTAGPTFADFMRSLHGWAPGWVRSNRHSSMRMARCVRFSLGYPRSAQDLDDPVWRWK